MLVLRDRHYLKMIRWKKVTEFPEYKISESGVVKRIIDDSIINQSVTKDGYSVVRLSKMNNENGIMVTKSKNVRVYRIVCEEFNGKCPSKDENAVDHKDMNQRNDHCSNLRWATSTVNNNNKRGMNTRNAGVKYDQKHDKWTAYIRHRTTKNVVLKSFDALKKDEAYKWLSDNLVKYEHKVEEMTAIGEIIYGGRVTSEPIEELMKDNKYPINCRDMHVFYYKEEKKYGAVSRVNKNLIIREFKQDEKEQAYAWAFKEFYRINKNKESNLYVKAQESMYYVNTAEFNFEKCEQKQMSVSEIDESDNKTFVDDNKSPDLKLKKLLNEASMMDKFNEKKSKKKKRNQNSSSVKSSVGKNKKGQKTMRVDI